MGDFEVWILVISTTILGVAVYNIITSLSYNDILRSFGFLNTTRSDFYECGFNPQVQSPVQLSLQFLLICVFFLLYDIELIFLFPFISGSTFTGVYELWLIFFFVFILFASLNIDYESHVLYWQE